MPALPSNKHAIVGIAGANSTVTYDIQTSVDEEDMLDNSVNAENGAGDNDNNPRPPTPTDKSELESNNYRNRTNTKVKLLVRSHAMRESASPPREAAHNNNNNNGSSSPRTTANEAPKYPPSLSPTPTNKLNNNDPIYSTSLTTTSPKQTRTIATSPTCRIPSSRNCQSASPSPTPPKSPINHQKDSGQRSKATSPHIPPIKCNNCVKNNQNDRPGLLQTPGSPSKSSIHHSPKTNNNRNDQRRPNTLTVCNNQCNNQCSHNTLHVRTSSRHKLRHQNIGGGSLDSNISPCLSRDSSTELYTDSTGIDLEQFIAVTINRNQKDRAVLLRIEKDLIEFAKDKQKVCQKFPNMSSYNRMLVHRVAAYFGMEHNVDQSGLSVIVTRTKNMRIPDTRFEEHIRGDLLLAEEPRRSILKRDSSSFEDGFNFKSPDRMSGDYCRRSKSFEEREEEYEKARRRIFKDSSGESSEVTSWPYWSSSESSETSAKYRLLHPGDHHSMRHRLAKGDSCDGRESFRGVLRPPVSKSFSFGGYTRGMLARGDSVSSTRSAGPRLTKQDSGASVCSRLSPSSSGYKSQSQRSDATISPSPSPSPVPNLSCSHVSSQNSTSIDGSQGNQTVMWAVSSISSVPPGSIIMNPRTNQPYTNADGSIYRFDPDNPPKIFSDISEAGESPCETPPEQFEESPRISPSKSSKNRKNSSKSSTNRVTNTATSPTMPFAASPPPPATVPIESPQPVKNAEPPACIHAPQPYTNYSSQNSSEMNFNQPTVYPNNQPPQGMVFQRQPEMAQQQHQQQQPPPPQQQQQQQQQSGIPPPADIVFGQNYGNYSPMTMHQACHPPANEVSDLSGYFMGMNVYEQPRVGSESQGTPTHGFNGPMQPPPPQASGGQAGQGYWQPPPPPPPPPVPPTVQQHGQSNPMTPQQTMYFVPPSGPTAAVTVSQAPADNRQPMHHQRFPGYAYNPQTMTPPNQPTAAAPPPPPPPPQAAAAPPPPNYVNGYPITYNSMPTVTPNPADYSYQSQLHMIPTYYPSGQPGIQPPVMWRVPTPPNTPTSNQIPGVPVMYVNSGSYGAPAMVAGSFGHQLPNAGTPGPPGAYMTPSILPNLVFRQNMPMMTTGIRASTPSGSQRTSRSPTPGHEFFNNTNNSVNNNNMINGNHGGSNNPGGGLINGDNRNAQAQSRYPLPMYQGLHIVQGDIRLMHPAVTANSRLQYAPVASPPVLQGCSRPFRPPSYSSNTSGCPTPNSYDGRGQKMRKTRSKFTTNLPPSGVRSNQVYQVPSMPSSLSSNPPNDMREGTVKVTITRQNQLGQC